MKGLYDSTLITLNSIKSKNAALKAESKCLPAVSSREENYLILTEEKKMIEEEISSLKDVIASSESFLSSFNFNIQRHDNFPFHS